jgi:phosphoribosylcarboxyaminoimidazole (NCAIR) mutase
MPSVASVAVRVTCSRVRSVTENTAAPLLESVTALAGEITALESALAASVTVLPLIALPLASRNLATITPGVVPSSGSNSGIAGPRGAGATIETEALTGPAL